LDIVPRDLTEDEKARGLTLEDRSVRNRISNNSIQKLLKQKPAPLTLKKNLALIEAGNLEDDLVKLKDVDWVIEVVVENLTVKNKCLKRSINLGNKAVLSAPIHREFLLKQW
jgi:3-hydroxyacyl-CoA dehydrogenase